MKMLGFFPSCQKVARQLAVGDIGDTSLVERLLPSLHLLMCQHCRRFTRQIKLINKTLRKLWREYPDPRSEAFKAVQERILARLKHSPY